ncbi:M24 family metallopeptidase [Candidatus Gracilibacteria bacterium]|nr:M24 family metallopeptidase [Candidatus Gracilibacteria bacterium]
MIKTKSEIEKIRIAQSHVDSILENDLKNWLREGVTEQEISEKLEKAIFGDGAFELAFPSIIAFGEGAAEPHHEPNQRGLRQGDPILIDCGAKFEGWCSDCTRMFCLGQPSLEFREKYEKVLKIHEEILLQFVAGAKVASLDAWVRERLGDDEQYFIHSLGHGIGREVHEEPRITSKKSPTQIRTHQIPSQTRVLEIPNPGLKELQKGMVVTCEPGLYYKDAFGIRIEDLLVIREGRAEILTQTPRTLILL